MITIELCNTELVLASMFALAEMAGDWEGTAEDLRAGLLDLMDDPPAARELERFLAANDMGLSRGGLDVTRISSPNHRRWSLHLTAPLVVRTHP